MDFPVKISRLLISSSDFYGLRCRIFQKAYIKKHYSEQQNLKTLTSIALTYLLLCTFIQHQKVFALLSYLQKTIKNSSSILWSHASISHLPWIFSRLTLIESSYCTGGRYFGQNLLVVPPLSPYFFLAGNFLLGISYKFQLDHNSISLKKRKKFSLRKNDVN